MDYGQAAAAYARHRQVHPGVLQGLLGARAFGKASSEKPQVLEVGCGTGNYVAAITTLTGAACWGIDPSPAMLARARARALPIELRIGSAERLGLPDGTFDLVFSVDVIHHIANRPAYVNETCRVLCPGGQLCTVTDSEWIIRHRQPLSTYFPETVAHELARYPRIETLRRLMAQAGLKHIHEEVVEHAYDLDDVQAYQDKAYSALHTIDPCAFERGLARMQRDLQSGPIRSVSRYTLLWGTKPSPGAPTVQGDAVQGT